MARGGVSSTAVSVAGAGVSSATDVAGGAAPRRMFSAGGAGVSWTAVIAAAGGGVSWTAIGADVVVSFCKTATTTVNTAVVPQANTTLIMYLSMRSLRAIEQSPASSRIKTLSEGARLGIPTIRHLDQSTGSNAIRIATLHLGSWNACSGLNVGSTEAASLHGLGLTPTRLFPQYFNYVSCRLSTAGAVANLSQFVQKLSARSTLRRQVRSDSPAMV